jgi:gas vesicle protein
MTKSGMFLLGATAGAVIALLYAPASGEETREQISKKSQDLLDELNDKIDEGKQLVDDLKRRAVHVKSRVAEAIREDLDMQAEKAANNGGHQAGRKSTGRQSSEHQ